jgi:predicted amidohydrolase
MRRKGSLRSDILAGVLGILACGPAQAAEPGSARPHVRIAGIVLRWIRADKELNWRRVEPLIREAARHGAQLVCTTECFLDGYAILALEENTLSADTYRKLAEPIPSGSYFQLLAALARELKIHLVAGMIEADRPWVFNTAVLIGPDGMLIGKYHKQRLLHETVANTPGKASPVFATPYGKVGIMICADRADKAIVRRYCDRGADFLLCPSGGMFGPRTNDPLVQSQSRANKTPIIFVHPVEFLVTGPDGSILARTILDDDDEKTKPVPLAISATEAGGARDFKKVFYFDLPLPRKPMGGD